MENRGTLKNKLYLQTGLFNQYEVPQASRSQDANAWLKLQIACLFLRILWMLSVSGSHSMCALADSGYKATKGLY